MPQKVRTKNFRVLKHDLDGSSLERWCLKVLIGICFQREHPIGPLATERGVAADNLVAACFGRSALSEPVGLYLLMDAGDEIRVRDGIGMMVLIDQTDHVAGGLFSLWGWRLLLWLNEDASPRGYRHIGYEDKPLNERGLMYRPKEIKIKDRKRLKQRFRLSWD